MSSRASLDNSSYHQRSQQPNDFCSGGLASLDNSSHHQRSWQPKDSGVGVGVGCGGQLVDVVMKATKKFTTTSIVVAGSGA